MSNSKRKFLKIVLMSLILACVVTILWIIVVSGMIPQQIIFRISIIPRQIISSISNIPDELIIMVGGYVSCALLVILIFIILYRKMEYGTYNKILQEYGKYIIILPGILALVFYLLGYIAGLSTWSRSVGGFMGWRFNINEFVILFWHLGNLCIFSFLIGLAVIVLLAVMLFYKSKPKKNGR